MADNRKAKAIARTVNNANKAEAEPRGGALRRAAKALEKASARENKVQGSLDKRNSQLDAALMTLEKTDVGSPKAREVEAAVRAALKELLVQRKKLRKARKALRRAEGKDRRVKERAAAAAVKKARAGKPAERTPKASKKRPAKKQKQVQGVAGAATKPRVMETMPPAEAGSGVEAGGLQESPGASRSRAPQRELD